GLRQVGEEGGDDDGVERLSAGEALGVGVGDEAVDAEGLLLETDAAGIDVRHPEALRGDVEHGEAGHPAVAAGEVQELEARRRLSESPAENGGHHLPDPAAGVEVEDEGLILVAAMEVEIVEEHLVVGVDVEV